MPLSQSSLLKFPLASSLRLLLASNAGLLVMLSLANFLLDACLRAIPLESAKSAVQCLVFFYYYIRHSLTPNLPPVMKLCIKVMAIPKSTRILYHINLIRQVKMLYSNPSKCFQPITDCFYFIKMLITDLSRAFYFVRNSQILLYKPLGSNEI